MDISQISSDMSASMVDLAYAVECAKAQQHTMMVASNIIEDVAEISMEALSKYSAEQH